MSTTWGDLPLNGANAYCLVITEVIRHNYIGSERMTYTATTWTTTTASRIKADYVVVYHDVAGKRKGVDANIVLTQIDESGGRRTILGVVDTTTCEVIAAPNIAGYVGLVSKAYWSARTVRIEMAPDGSREPRHATYPA
jgi:hypothetical protein